MKRNVTLDITRTIAIVLMVVFHFLYDLKFFNFVDWDTPDGHGWKEFRFVIITLFFLCLGVSLTFAYSERFHFKKFALRVGQIVGSALVISIVTYIVLPANWIFFGVLHFLALSAVMVIWFVKLPVLSMLIGLIIIAFGVSEHLPNRWPFDLLFTGLPSYTNDYVAIQPWLGVVFLGVSIAHSSWLKSDPLKSFLTTLTPKRQKYLLWPGQHSLSIYLLHQPIMLGLLALIAMLFR